LPDRVVVDVSALIRRRLETDPDADIWRAVLAATARSQRDILWLIAPTSYGNLVEPQDLAAAEAALRVAGVQGVVVSTEPTGALLAAVVPPDERVGVVTAGLEERPYELALLGTVNAMLDLGTGVLWRRVEVEVRFGRLDILPELFAITGVDGEQGLGGNAAPRYRDGIRQALEGKVAWPEAAVHPAVKASVSQNQVKIAARARALRGLDRPADPAARAAVTTRLNAGPMPDTAYVAARLTRTRTGYTLEEVHAEVGTRELSAVGEAASTALLHSLVATGPPRWFAPHAMDLLAAMDERRLALPAAAVDPALIAFVLNTAAPPTLTEVAPELCLPRSAARWYGDLKRDQPAPRELETALGSLRELDAALHNILVTNNLLDLVEKDIAGTLPVLARIERMGAWVGQPQGYKDWKALFVATEKELRQHEQDAAPFTAAGQDIYTASYDALVGTLKSFLKKRLPPDRWSSDLSAEEEFDRYVELKVKEAVAVDEARSIASPSGSYFWLKEMARSPVQVRGLSVPQARGRFGMRDLPLQNLPKRSGLGKTIRSGLLAPPDHVLVGADQNGYEVRLLADLSLDPDLLQATTAPDVHLAIAQKLFGSSTPRDRKLAKLGMYALLYGQTEEQFRRSRSELTNVDAVNLYNKVKATFANVFAFRDQQLQAWQTQVRPRTRGGWPLDVDPEKSKKRRERSRFNGLVQGLAADIQRWVLRELDPGLRKYNARIVHQAHDEVFVAVPVDGDVAGVERLLVDTMTSAVMSRSRLLQHPVQLVATPRRGSTWRDLM
jgi:hypothetical protein